MTYIERMNAFHRWLEHNYLPHASQLLYFRLLDFFNRCGWAEWVSVDNLRLMCIIQVESKNTFLRARDKLIQAGWLEYRKGKKGTPNQYHLGNGPKTEPQIGLQTELQTELYVAPEVAPQVGHIIRPKTKTKTIEKVSNETQKKAEATAPICREDYVSMYNEICTQLPVCKILTENRKKAISIFSKQLSYEQFREVCQRANASAFCTGSNDRGWKATFDFLIRADKAAGVLEGKYDDERRDIHGRSNQTENSTPHPSASQKWGIRSDLDRFLDASGPGAETCRED